MSGSAWDPIMYMLHGSWPKGSRLRMQTREHGIVEMALDENGQTVEKVPESITVMQAWMVTPDGYSLPIRAVSEPNGGPADGT